ncbi:hypothetical protein AU106_gp264 [Sinorhizobium phage phiM9]|uniref:Uncharacterized protein n=1 Tax=Sinorhizobium phage phiM9 TaxID=1636182 RepID=A0A0F6R651_9CAUD|nr:hypothetical protein AU106_gp264 [Sinorhizobium phage phiM9]AKE44895.1 hypothetical protein Sm_phiM9_268 [Sinorhizobium phage phiM9]
MLLLNGTLEEKITNTQKTIESYKTHLDKLVLEDTNERIFKLIVAHKNNDYAALLGSNLGTSFLKERFGEGQMTFVWDEQIDYHTLWLKPERKDFSSKPEFSSMTRYSVMHTFGAHLKKIRFCIGRFHYDYTIRKTHMWDRNGLVLCGIGDVLNDIIQLAEEFPYVEVRKSV